MTDTVVCIPTRGLIFTEVVGRLQETPEVPLLMTSGVSVPDAFNLLTEKALLFEPRYVLFIEEDTVPPPGFSSSMRELLAQFPNIGAVTIEYPVNKSGYSSVVHHEASGDILYCGLGCTMVRAEVFLQMDRPWFRSDRKFILDPPQQRGWTDCDPAKQYGLYDVLFFTKMRALGYTIAQAPGRCRHLEAVKSFTPQQNGSVYSIEEKSLQINPSRVPLDPRIYL